MEKENKNIELFNKDYISLKYKKWKSINKKIEVWFIPRIRF